ncbi:MAG TPA: phosphatase PAP2 family protein [Solirubrobacteraceae bacterium]|nr:phosphatase PAP2 family protein [Solirubrobacteraceae bacterium]
MLRRLPARIEGRLPKGWMDLARQVGLFGFAYLVYRLVEGAANHSSALASAHATEIISLEQSLHVFAEQSIQSWASGSHVLMVVATYVYVNAQTTILIALLLYFYLAHNRHYYFVRNTLFVAMAIGLTGYLLFPTMPPRFMSNWGFVDTVSSVTGTSPMHGTAQEFFNPYAAVPSMHVAFALIFGLTLVRLSRSWAARAWWACWPLLITFVTVITANHFFLDAVLGALTAAIAAGVALRLARIRPHVWAFAPQPAAAALAPAPTAQVAVS